MERERQSEKQQEIGKQKRENRKRTDIYRERERDRQMEIYERKRGY